MSQLFADLGLMADLTRAVADHGYTQPTPVQMEAIPVILDGRDVLAGAQTGTGKTAAFTLPLLQRLMTTLPESGLHPIRALIVTPTRELAAQIEESVRTYGKYLPLRSTVVFGGVGITPQIDALKEGVDILVATPGRLLDHANEQTVDLSQVEILVLDEADRMLDMGFIHDVKRILALLPAQRQNLLFSATFSDDIRALADGLLDNPVMVEVARRNAESELVAQRVHPVGQDRKRALLAHLVKTGDWKQVLVFTRTKHGANRLAHQLGRSGISATAIHGNKSQGARTKALADFKAGLVRVLVATDLAARGLDIEELPHVVNYDMPHVAEDYVHRIGRTGRAGVTGEAISLVSLEEMPLLAEIEKLMRRTVEQTVIPGFEPGIGPTVGEAAVDRAPQGDSQPRQTNDGGRQPNPAGGPREEREGREGREGRGRRRSRGRNRTNGTNGANSTNSTNSAHREQPPGFAVAGTEAPLQAPQQAPRHGPRQGPGPREALPRGNRNEVQRGEANRSGSNRQETTREDRDNRGNRDTTNRNRDNRVLRDDDYGNRIPPAKVNRNAVLLTASGEINEDYDNRGNRLPPAPKAGRNFGTDDEINFNMALPPPPAIFDDDVSQPASNVGQMFPSTAGFMGDGRPTRGNGNARNRGNTNSRRRGQGKGQGKGQGQAQRPPQRQQQRQPHRQGQRGAAQGGGAGRQDKRR